VTGSETLDELAARALAVSRADGCVVLVEQTRSADVRWANNTMTTNGSSTDARLSVVSILDGRVGVATRTVGRRLDVPAAVRASEAAAAVSRPSPDADALPGPDGTPSPPPVAAEPPDDGIARVVEGLAEAFSKADRDRELLYGFADQRLTTTVLASSAGVHRRHVQPGGSLAATAKSRDLSRSAWQGVAGASWWADDVTALHGRLRRLLGWQERRVELPAAPYEVLLSPSAVSDLLLPLVWSAPLRDALEGHGPFARPDGGTRLGDRFCPLPLTIASDPGDPRARAMPFVATTASGAGSSVFDDGLGIGRTSLLAEGVLAALVSSRAQARRAGLAPTPLADNLLVDGGSQATRDLAAMVAATEGPALLISSLWYIRDVDPEQLLLTGLTRDGVYLVEGGRIVATVNNFRFNESPVDMLQRVTEIGRAVPALPREWGDWFERAVTPPLRVAGFRMSSVSEAR
jgi:predicted Zn-dependent protease